MKEDVGSSSELEELNENDSDEDDFDESEMIEEVKEHSNNVIGKPLE